MRFLCLALFALLGLANAKVTRLDLLGTGGECLNSKAVNRNRNRSIDYGIFQINNGYWCSPGRHNECKVSCSALKSDNIGPSIKCAKQIYKRHGFNAWYGWKRKCKGKKLSSYVKGCRY
ncbi:hypothetical protein MRX96_007774 [Rhipicephalus microplus]